MQKPSAINTLYSGLATRQPYRFVICRYKSTSHAVFERYQSTSLRQFVIRLLKVFEEESPEFLERLVQVDYSECTKRAQRTRRYIAESKNQIYPDSSHLTERYVEPYGKHWFATNIGVREAKQIVREVAAAANVPCRPVSEAVL